ncbi:MAG: FHA domain-containing protein [Desulfobacula sp.]|nr:FHA domain-containing protein [Desulfobacula sp.]
MPKIICKKCEHEYDPVDKGVCPNCGSMETNLDDKDTSVELEAAPDLVEEKAVHQLILEYQHLKLEKSQHGTVPLRLTNPNEYNIKEINFCATSAAFLENKIEERITARLKSGNSTRIIPCDFDITDRTGPYSAKVDIIVVDTKDLPAVFSGLFYINIRELGYQPPKIDLTNTRIIGSDIDVEASEIAFGENKIVGSNITIKQPKESHFGEKSDWLKVSIEFDLEKTKIIQEQRKEKDEAVTPAPPPPPPPLPSATTRAVISYQADGEPSMVHIWSGRECFFGRNHLKSQIVAIRLPNDEANQKWNNYISGKHFGISIKSYKKVILKDYSTNGTFINGKKTEKEVSLKHGDAITLAKSLSLNYYAFRDLSSVRTINQNLNNCRTVLECTTALSSLDMEDVRSKTPIDSILIKRTDSFKNKLEYLLIARSAEIGSGLTVPIQIKHETVDDQHAKLTIDSGNYYIEDLNSKNGTCINGDRVDPYHRIQLAIEDILQIGDVKITFRRLT